MREIKFRGKVWTYGQREWRTGGYEYFNGVHYIIIDGQRHAADPETIGQYTGFKDKDGVEIWEGDIVSSLYKRDGCIGVYEIVWSNYAFRPYKRGEHQQKNVSISMLDLRRCERVGNRYDNPELLEVKSERD